MAQNGSGSGFDFLGGIIGSGVSAIAQERANKSNERIARENREWQERMSNTAHTREVADLRNAGLNPILSVTGGSGASSPAGSTATMNSVFSPDSMNAVSSAFGRAIQRRQLENTVRLGDETIKTQQSQQSLNSASALQAMASAGAQSQLSNLYRANAVSSALSNMRESLRMPEYKAKAAPYKAAEPLLDDATNNALEGYQWLRSVLPW